MGLIEQAQRNLSEQERLAQEQKEADLQFAQMYQDSFSLLETYGERIKDEKDRLTYGVMYPFYYLIKLSRKAGDVPTLAEIADHKELKANIDSDENNVTVTLKSSTAIPQEKGGYFVAIQIETLDQSLELRGQTAFIYRGNPFGYAYPEKRPIRKANLEDAHKWSEVISLVKQKYPTSSPNSIA